ncbi:hypothetical protein NKG05_06660 [Oerskovia sp. M15]
MFARELVDPVRRRDDLPLLVFLQGGPGGKGPRPTGPDGWVGTMLATHRVILLDQRGTGRSTAVRGRSLTALGDAAAQAEHLAHFRADSIVADAEHLRRTLFGGRRWSRSGRATAASSRSPTSRAPRGPRRLLRHGWARGPGGRRDRGLPPHLPAHRGQERPLRVTLPRRRRAPRAHRGQDRGG